jgi:hypothetical protein
VKRFVSLQFSNLRQSVGLLVRGICHSQGGDLYRTAQTQNKRRQTSMPRVRFEPTIPVFEWGKTVHALDRAATVIDRFIERYYKFVAWNMLQRFYSSSYGSIFHMSETASTNVTIVLIITSYLANSTLLIMYRNRSLIF